MRRRTYAEVAALLAVLAVAGCRSPRERYVRPPPQHVPHPPPPPRPVEPSTPSSWSSEFPAAARDLGVWIEEDPAGAERVMEWDRTEPERSQEFSAWLLSHPRGGADQFQRERGGSRMLSELTRRGRDTIGRYARWCRLHPGAVRELAIFPGGLDWVGHRLRRPSGRRETMEEPEE